MASKCTQPNELRIEMRLKLIDLFDFQFLESIPLQHSALLSYSGKGSYNVINKKNQTNQNKKAREVT